MIRLFRDFLVGRIVLCCAVVLSVALPLQTAIAQQGPTTLTLLTNASVTGSAIQWPGGIGVVACVGVWNGATVTFQFIGPDGATYIPAGAATTLTANGAGVFYLNRLNVRAAITNAGGSTSLTCTASVVPNLIQ